MYIMEMHVYIIETHVHIMEMHMYIMEMHLHICMWDAYARLVERSEPHAGGLDRRWVAAGLARGRALLARAECLRSVHVASKGESFHHRPAYICMCHHHPSPARWL